MRFQEYMKETTKFAKAMQYFNGLKDFGVGMGIFTTMNPSAKEVGQEKNKKLYKDLLSLLKSKGKKYIKQIGQYDVSEKSVIVINISLKEILNIAKSSLWKQQSVIWFSKKDNEKIKSALIGNGGIIKSKSIDSGKITQELTNYYSIIGNRKYSMKFESDKRIFYRTQLGDMIEEKWYSNIKSTVPGKDKKVEVFKNPTSRDKKSLGNIIRFTAYNKTKTVYAWVYDQAHHHDVSKAVGIKHRFNDPDLLTGVATWKGGKWVFSSSDFLKDFKKMVGSEGEFLNDLLNNDWSWVTSFLDLETTLDKLRGYLKGKL